MAMRIALFCHTLLSDWNHGNAHFLRGICAELIERGHEVRVFEPHDAWSLENLLRHEGRGSIERLRTVYPFLDPVRYELATLDLDAALDGVDLAIVHEWNPPELVARLSRRRLRGNRTRLLFHDTHHRMVTAPDAMARYDLSGFDGVLAFGAILRDLYLDRGLANKAWVWHEAADTRVFRPLPFEGEKQSLVWIGNWGDEERTAELREFLFEPCRALQLEGTVYGVRYPQEALEQLDRFGLRYRGWIPNFEVPSVLVRHRLSVHVPRRPYVEALPGIPTIRPFEVMACGVPLVSAPWNDCEGLFVEGRDYLVARDGTAMRDLIRMLLAEADLARSIAESGRRRILERHTCAHRVDELLAIAEELGVTTGREGANERT